MLIIMKHEIDFLSKGCVQGEKTVTLLVFTNLYNSGDKIYDTFLIQNIAAPMCSIHYE